MWPIMLNHTKITIHAHEMIFNVMLANAHGQWTVVNLVALFRPILWHLCLHIKNDVTVRSISCGWLKSLKSKPFVLYVINTKFWTWVVFVVKFASKNHEYERKKEVLFREATKNKVVWHVDNPNYHVGNFRAASFFKEKSMHVL